MLSEQTPAEVALKGGKQRGSHRENTQRQRPDQDHLGGARKTQEHQGEPRRSQEEPGGARKSQEGSQGGEFEDGRGDPILSFDLYV